MLYYTRKRVEKKRKNYHTARFSCATFQHQGGINMFDVLLDIVGITTMMLPLLAMHMLYNV